MLFQLRAKVGRNRLLFETLFLLSHYSSPHTVHSHNSIQTSKLFFFHLFTLPFYFSLTLTIHENRFQLHFHVATEREAKELWRPLWRCGREINIQWTFNENEPRVQRKHRVMVLQILAYITVTYYNTHIRSSAKPFPERSGFTAWIDECLLL